MAQCIWHTEDQWEDAGAKLRRLSSPQQTQRHHQLRPSICQHQPPASSPGPGARWWLGAGRGPALTTLNSIDFCFRFPQQQRVSGARSPGCRLQARAARHKLSPARPRRHGRGVPASLDPHKATARPGPGAGTPVMQCSLQPAALRHCSTAVPTLFLEAHLKHQTRSLSSDDRTKQAHGAAY